MDLTSFAAVAPALVEHGRARRGRPRKDSKIPTRAQLGLSKWELRKALALAALDPETFEGVVAKRISATTVIEHQSRLGRRRNPLFRAWDRAMASERNEFLDVLQQALLLRERADAVKGLTGSVIAGPEEERKDLEIGSL